jgi:hypothetical protein
MATRHVAEDDARRTTTEAPMIVLGIDPGARWTALVVREGDHLIDRDLLDRETYRASVAGITLADDRITEWARYCTVAATGLIRSLRDVADVNVEAIGVEGVVAPRPHAAPGKGPRLTDVGPTIETAWVAGALCERLNAVVVEPSGFGAPAPNRRVLEAMYPADLIGPRETTGSGKTSWQHLRAAYDIAGAVPATLRRLQA